MSAVSTPIVTTAPTTAPTTSPASPSDGMEHGVYYAHYLRDSATKPAPTYYKALLEGATRKVIIWDPYFNQNDTEIFSWLKNTVDVTVLSSKSAMHTGYLQDLVDNTKLQLPNTLRGSCVFTFGYIDTCRYGADMWKSHDRYLIIDDIDYYLIGSSVSYHREAHQSTGIYQVTEQRDKDVIQDAFDKTFSVCTTDRTFKTETI